MLAGECVGEWLLASDCVGEWLLTDIRTPDDDTQEVPKHVRDCYLLCSHFSAFKVGLISWILYHAQYVQY